MFVVFRWWCPYTTGPSPATRICALATAGMNSRMVSPVPVNKRFMNTSWPPSLHDIAFVLHAGERIGHFPASGYAVIVPELSTTALSLLGQPQTSSRTADV